MNKTSGEKRESEQALQTVRLHIYYSFYSSVLRVVTNFKGRLMITEAGWNNGTGMKLALRELDCKGRDPASFT